MVDQQELNEEEAKLIDEEEESDYQPKQDEDGNEVPAEEEKQEIVQPPQPTFKAIDIWISETGTSKHIVVLALFKSSEGNFEFRTIGNNPNGLLGQGKDRKESPELQVIDFGVELKEIEQVEVGF